MLHFGMCWCTTCPSGMIRNSMYNEAVPICDSCLLGALRGCFKLVIFGIEEIWRTWWAGWRCPLPMPPPNAQKMKSTCEQKVRKLV